MDKQKTIAKECSVSGIGLHTGNKATAEFFPADPNTGIEFVRVDLPGKPAIRLSFENILPQERTPRRTALGVDGVEVQTVEHLMAAISGLGIDNLRIEIDNNEIPGLDGSSIKFVECFERAGLTEQPEARNVFSLKEAVIIEDGGSSLMALPAQGFKISYMLDYNHPLIKTGYLEVALDAEVFKKELAGARTFCLEEEADKLRSDGMGLGANYENTLVVGKKGVIKNTLRFPDELLRHKMLDLMGDLFFAGPLRAHIIGMKSGHALNLKMVKAICAQKEKYSFKPTHLPLGPGRTMEVEDIKNILPHREPFLFVDRIISIEHGKRATGIKNVTINDYFFKGHFPQKPVMPGVLIIEAMAQVGGVMMLASEENRGKLAFFMSMDKVKFRKPVVPGDQLVFELEAVKVKSKTGQVRGKALVDGKVIAEAELMFALVEN
jgi:UDP-3-O-[3-hydroxymyristoyl] N-acetylglucosamine deacetylase/3-hydroxyacyl-[acyl-carrier-protein] dehydratase